MKKIISLQVFLLVTIAMFGQQFTLSQKTVSVEGSVGKTLQKIVQITNNSITDTDFTWTLINASLKNSWAATLCDPTVCQSWPFSASNAFELGMGKTKTFKLDVEAITECGSGQVAIAVKLNSDPTNIDTLVFNLKAWCTNNGVEDVKSKTPKVILYDAADNVQLSGISDFKQVKILDMNGRAVATQPLNGSDLQSISLPFLPKGVYIFHFEKFGIEVNVKFVKF